MGGQGDEQAVAFAHIDARRPAMPVGTRVAGVPLVARHARALARAGFAGAVVVAANEADSVEIQRSLADRPPPRTFRVAVAVGAAPVSPAPAGPVLTLAVDTVYTPDRLKEARLAGAATAEPLVELRGVSDVSRAESLLVGRLRKSVDMDGVVAYYAVRPLTRAIGRRLADTRVTPNQVTVTAGTCGLAAVLCAAAGGHAATVAAAILIWIGFVIDCVDGELARLRLEGSRLGEWLDTLADDLSTYGLLAGLGVGLARDGAGHGWGWLGLVGALLGLATQAKQYVDLHRMGMPIDTAQYPWFFGQASEGAGKDRGLFGRLFYAVTFLFRRDAYVTILAVLLLCGAREAAAGILLGGALLMAALLVAHISVISRRGPEGPHR